MQYWNESEWKTISGTTEKENKYAQVYLPFKKAIITSKVRFSSEAEGALKVREIKLFGKDALPSETPNYNISGIQRTGQVVRLFAKGFKEERDLLEVERSTKDNGLDTYVSLDKNTDTYYMWLVQRGNFAYHLNMDVSNLDLQEGTPIVGETVDANTFGEVATLMNLNADKKIKLTLSPQSVTLLTIQKGDLNKETSEAISDASVFSGSNSSNNYGSKEELEVSLDAGNPDKNKVSYLSFKTSKDKNNIKKVLLNITGKVDAGDKLFRMHVYAIPSEKINENTINWKNAPNLGDKEALIENVGNPLKVAGEIGFTSEEKTHYLDVTDIIVKNKSEDITFILVRETRQLGDDSDKGRTVLINSKEAQSNTPSLEIWSKK